MSVYRNRYICRLSSGIYFSENEKVLPGFPANGSAFSLFFEEFRDMTGLSGLFSDTVQVLQGLAACKYDSGKNQISEKQDRVRLVECLP